MSNLGWISLHRQITNSWVWEDKPFAYGQAWTDMLLMANHVNNRYPLGNEIVTLQAGDFVTSELKLMGRWGWSKSKVRRFLQLLESDGMIIKKTDRKKTTITIVNYSKFQNMQTDSRPIKDQSQTDSRPIKDTNNNVNNDNNVNNNIICSDSAEPSPKQNNKKFTPPNLEEVQQYCSERNNSVNARTFIDFYESKGWMVGKNKMKDWKAAVRTWERNSKTSKGVNETSGNSIYDTNAGWERAKRAIAEAKHNSAGGEDLPFK